MKKQRVKPRINHVQKKHEDLELRRFFNSRLNRKGLFFIKYQNNEDGN
jgi:hypothetical protein